MSLWEAVQEIGWDGLEARMSYQAVFKIFPSGLFGLPDGDKILVPADKDGKFHISTPVFEKTTGRIASLGTLSTFRETPLRVSASIEEVAITVHDNFLEATFSAKDDGEAFSTANKIGGLIPQLLTLANQESHYFWSELEIIYKDRDPLQMPIRLHLGEYQGYNLKKFEEQVMTGLSFGNNVDEVGAKALQYFYHASFLMTKRITELNHFNVHNVFLAAQGVLFCYKSSVAILGEPGQDNDYQSRYKEYGISNELRLKVHGEMKTARDKYDVAHHTIDHVKADELLRYRDRAFQVSKEVLTKYFEFLKEHFKQ